MIGSGTMAFDIDISFNPKNTLLMVCRRQMCNPLAIDWLSHMTIRVTGLRGASSMSCGPLSAGNTPAAVGQYVS
jgi:hypothetical protein